MLDPCVVSGRQWALGPFLCLSGAISAFVKRRAGMAIPKPPPVRKLNTEESRRPEISEPQGRRRTLVGPGNVRSENPKPQQGLKGPLDASPSSARVSQISEPKLGDSRVERCSDSSSCPPPGRTPPFRSSFSPPGPRVTPAYRSGGWSPSAARPLHLQLQKKPGKLGCRAVYTVALATGCFRRFRK